MCLFKALLKKWDSLLRKLFQNEKKNKGLLKVVRTIEKMGKFIKRTVSNSLRAFKSFYNTFYKYPTSQKFGRSGGREKRQAQRATTGERRGERSELPWASVASQRLSTSTQRSSGAVPAGPLVNYLNLLYLLFLSREVECWGFFIDDFSKKV